MSKKHKVSAQKMKNVSDPSLARSHKEGAVVELVQPANDKKWGRYYFNHYRRYYLFLRESQNEYLKTMKLLTLCRKTKVDEVRGTRHIEVDLRDKLELHSVQFLILLKLGFEYLTLEMLPTVNQIQTAQKGVPKTKWDTIDLNERLNVLVKYLHISIPAPSYLFDLFNRRDIVEHPTSERLYNATENGWKNNHLAWVLSGDVEGMDKKIVVFVNSITETFDKYVKDNPIPGKLEGVQRGLKSADQFKK